MSAQALAALHSGIEISGGQAGLGLIVIFCIAAIWAAADHRSSQHDNNKPTANNNKER